MDDYSHWIECVALRSLTAKECCDALISFFCRIGLPSGHLILRNDNGSNFVSDLNKEIYKRLGIELRCSTPLHPESNGLIERYNQTIKRILSHVMNSNGLENGI